MKKQKGFTVAEVLLIVLVLGLIGGTGWFVWHSKNSTDKNLNNANSSSSISTKSLPQSSHKTLTIAEWGVRAEYSSPVTLTYKIYPSASNPTISNFTSVELNKIPTCKDDTAGGFVRRYKPTDHYLVGDDGIDSGKTAAEYAATLKKDAYSYVGGYYYFYIGIQGVCGPDGSQAAALQSDTVNAVQSALKNLQSVSQ